MKLKGYWGIQNIEFEVTDLPGLSDRQLALSLAVKQRGISASSDEVIDTAMSFEYFLHHGEGPSE